MAKNTKSGRGLGRGLSALMSDVGADAPESAAPAKAGSMAVPIEQVYPNPDQPRQNFDQTKLEELAQSIRHRGVIQPLIVREKKGPGGELYQIVAGERRWRASQLAERHDVPIIIRDFTDVEVLEVAIIENIQRSDLNPIDEGAGYKQLIEAYGHTQEQLAEALGKSRSHIANQMRLLSLPEKVKAFVIDGRLSAGHARAILTAPDPEGLAQQVISKGLSVRETEKRAKAVAKEKAKPSLKKAKDADTAALEDELSAHLKLGVRIDHSGQDGGRITLTYKSLEQLDDLVRILSS